MTPKISVIVPCYNIENDIASAIKSLLAQDFAEFEALIIDDGSTDCSAQIARAAMGDDPRFHLVTQANQGLSAARNTGLALARGTYVAFLDGDDHYAASFLSRLEHCLAQTGAPWAACAIWLDYPDQDSVAHSAIHGAPGVSGAPRAYDLSDARVIARHFPSAWNKLYRRDFIGAQRFPPNALYEDHPFYWALACRSDQLMYLPEPLYHHRRGRAGQITAQGTAQIFQQFDRLDEVRDIVARSGRRYPKVALSRLATRLVHERLQPVTDADLRAEFLARAQQYFRENALLWDWDGGTDIDLSLATDMSPDLRFTALVQHGPGAEATWQALADQKLPPTRILEVPPGPAPKLLDEMRDTIETSWLAILASGDRPKPDWSARLLQTLRDSPQATWALCPAEHAKAARYDRGLALPHLPCCDPAALMMSAKTILPKANNAPDWTSSLRLGLGGGMAPDSRFGFDGAPCLTLSDRPADTAWRTLGALRVLQARDGLQPADAAAVYAHHAQLAVLAQTGRAARFIHALLWGAVRRLGRLPRPPATPYIGERLRRLL